MLNFLIAVLASLDNNITIPIQVLEQLILNTLYLVRSGQRNTELDCERGEGDKLKQIVPFQRNGQHTEDYDTFKLKLRFAEGMLVTDRILEILGPSTSTSIQVLEPGIKDPRDPTYSRTRQCNSDVSYEGKAVIDVCDYEGNAIDSKSVYGNVSDNDDSLRPTYDKPLLRKNGTRNSGISGVESGSSENQKAIATDLGNELISTVSSINSLLSDLYDFKLALVALANKLNQDGNDDANLEHQINFSRILNNDSEPDNEDFVCIEDETLRLVDKESQQESVFLKLDSMDEEVDSIKNGLEHLTQLLNARVPKETTE